MKVCGGCLRLIQPGDWHIQYGGLSTGGTYPHFPPPSLPQYCHLNMACQQAMPDVKFMDWVIGDGLQW